MNASSEDTRRVRALADVLEQLVVLHVQLLESIGWKLSAMRAADMNELETAARAEQSLVASIQDRDTLRRKLVEDLVRPYGRSPVSARTLGITAIAQQFGGSQTKRLQQAGRRLKELVTEINQENRKLQLISAAIMRHMQAVFAAMTSGDSDSAQYAPGGVRAQASTRRIFDAVG